MEQTPGVSIADLHCPTCGEEFIDCNLYSDPGDFDVDLPPSPIVEIPKTKWYIKCPIGHKWTVNKVWRRLGYPLRIQLGEYLGEN